MTRIPISVQAGMVTLCTVSFPLVAVPITFADNALATPLVISVNVFVFDAPGAMLTTTNRFCRIVWRVTGQRVAPAESEVESDAALLFGGMKTGLPTGTTIPPLVPDQTRTAVFVQIVPVSPAVSTSPTEGELRGIKP